MKTKKVILALFRILFVFNSSFAKSLEFILTKNLPYTERVKKDGFVLLLHSLDRGPVYRVYFKTN
ncbi:MAG: hypothetical protein H0U95_14035 [Bacteroidetes bacterium]|nr:hypothetical protein [Bacteroidota bacterium]